MVLVLLPAMAISAFGFVAIRYERQSAKQRLFEEAKNSIEIVKTNFFSRIEKNSLYLESLVKKQSLASKSKNDFDLYLIDKLSKNNPVELIFVGELIWPGFSETLSPDSLDEIHALFSKLHRQENVHFYSTEKNGVIAVHRLSNDHLVSYLVTDRLLQQSLELEGHAYFATGDHKNLNDYQITYRKLNPRKKAVLGLVDRFIQDLVQKAQTSQNELLLESSLPSPFDHYILEVRPGEQLPRLNLLYILLLVIFYITIIVGVVLTSRLIWQETRLSRLKTDFVSHVSHELRTPLTSIRIFIETLQMGKIQDIAQQKQCIDLLSQETERLSMMIERVLGYARLQGGYRSFNMKTIGVQQLVDDSLKVFYSHQLFHEEEELSVEMQVDDKLPAVHADQQAIVEVLSNLIGNAYKYAREPKVIKIKAYQKKKVVFFEVEDNGPGLAKTELKKVFERFYQSGESLLSQKKDGSGLGLAICKAIVAGHGGKISVQSTVGQGCVFKFPLKTEIVQLK